MTDTQIEDYKHIDAEAARRVLEHAKSGSETQVYSILGEIFNKYCVWREVGYAEMSKPEAIAEWVSLRNRADGDWCIGSLERALAALECRIGSTEETERVLHCAIAAAYAPLRPETKTLIQPTCCEVLPRIEKLAEAADRSMNHNLTLAVYALAAGIAHQMNDLNAVRRNKDKFFLGLECTPGSMVDLGHGTPYFGLAERVSKI